MKVHGIIKYLFFILIFVYKGTAIQAQPFNDLCQNAFEIKGLPYCSSTIFTNLNANPDYIGDNNVPSCYSSDPSSDVWFSFIPDADNNELTISITGNDQNGDPVQNLQATVYRGNCGINDMIERDCAISGPGETSLVFDVQDLTIGEKYYLRIDNYNGNVNSGDFNICIKKREVFNIKKDKFSDNCEGIIFDSGGEAGDFQNNENYTFTICPGNVSGTGIPVQISLEFEYYHLPCINQSSDTSSSVSKNEGDYIKIFSGADTTFSPILIISGNEKYKNIEGYVFGGGTGLKLCVESPCLTVQFVSDDTISGRGFKIKWNCSDLYCIEDSYSDFVVKSDISEETLLSRFVNKGVETEITKITCDKKAYGIYENFSENSELQQGLIMTTGLAEYVKGPNTFSSRSFILNSPGDQDLDSLSFINNKYNWQRSTDACIIEMDVVPYGNEISYNYLFGSEEYPEYANSPYNDIFALFISGKGITGHSSLKGQLNMAKIPNTNADVEINSINHINNWQYYHSNIKGKFLEYDGFVWDSQGKMKYLTAKQKVIPCETYHIKFAVADRGDTLYDSGVFISGLTDGRPEINTEILNSDFLVDNCSALEGKIYITTKSIVYSKEEYQIEISGTAVNGVDYLLSIPSEIIFEPGEYIREFDVKVIEDFIPEGTETIIISLYTELSCGRKLIDKELIEIRDKTELTIEADADTISTCKNNVLNFKASGTGFVSWEPKQLFEDANAFETKFYPDTSRWIYLHNRLIDTLISNCYGIDSIYISVDNKGFKISGDSIVRVCENGYVRLHINTDPGTGQLEWVYNNRIVRDAKEILIEEIKSDFMVYAIYSDGDCIYYDSVFINSVPIVDPDIIIDKEIIFYGDTITVSAFPEPDFLTGDSLKWDINGNITENEDVIVFSVHTDTLYIYLSLMYDGYCPGDTFLKIKSGFRDLIFPDAVIAGIDKSDHFGLYNHYSGLVIDDLSIFDRWGERVFSCNELDCAILGWDGMYRGVKCIPGVYLYSCNYKDPYGNAHSQQGSFLLLE